LSETSTAGQLNRLAEAGWLPDSAADTLCATHDRLSRARHLSSIARCSSGKPVNTGASRSICAELLGPDAAAWFSSEPESDSDAGNAPRDDHSG
jgi:hypothetical protein